MAEHVSPEVVVVGVGVMGAATGWALTRAGRRVLLLDQFHVGHTRGSSHGRSRIFRLSYDDPRFVGMAQEALPLWRALEREVGEPLLTLTGLIGVGERVPAHVAALEACGAAYELLDGREAARRFPGLALPAGPVLFQPDAGFVRADRAWRAFVAGARARGAELREGVRVVGIDPEGDGVRLATMAGEVRARAAVVTAGPWARSLLATAGIDLRVIPTRETVAYFRLSGAASLPALVEWDTPPRYAVPSPGEGLKAGEHRAGPVADPDGEGAPDGASLARVASWVRQRYPHADPEPRQVETCFYTNTAREDFVLERQGPIVVGSPCSGHGFKFAPLVGQRLADLVLGLL